MDTENVVPTNTNAISSPAGDVDTPTKKGTLSKLKEIVLSPLKSLSPTKTIDLTDLRKVTWSPGVPAIEPNSRRNSSRRRLKPGASPKKGTGYDY